MSSVEIEDVLSSIRRLVTEDLRPKPVFGDKLILTPALRVVASSPPQMQDETARLVVPDRGQGNLAEDLAINPDAEPQYEDMAEAAPHHAYDDDLAADDAASLPMFVHHAAEPVPEAPFQDLDAAPDDDDAPAASEAVVTIGAAVPDEGYESETGEAGPGDVIAVPDWPESSWVAPEVIDGVEEAEVLSPYESPAPWAQEPEVDTLFVEEPAAEPFFADEQNAGFDMDAAEAAALADLEGAAPGLDAEPSLTELDEDMLRDIVRDIIREELQGTLGERITRNVRKLVRAEINRAMITQDLD
jgi:hypothetical protein